MTDNCKGLTHALRRQYPLGTCPLLGQGEKWESKGGEGDGRQWEPGDLLPGRGVFADNLSLPFMWFFLFFFFKATVTGAMKVNTLQLLLLFSYYPADPGTEPDVVNYYKASVHTPRLTLPSCLTLTQCPHSGLDGLKSQRLI